MLRERCQTQKTAHICYDSFIRDIQNKHTYRDGELVVGCQRLRRKGSRVNCYSSAQVREASLGEWCAG